ncbi:hypothetical protein DFH09DRAFT_1069493 [Mycena vulgaris]|nr:hypothetical protein DFH09DRAFT_1069493 [Mycena vulgaris]
MKETPFILTLRVNELRAFGSDHIEVLHNWAGAWIMLVLSITARLMPSCMDIEVEAADLFVLGCTLGHLKSYSVPSVRSFSVEFAIRSYLDFAPSSISDFDFAVRPVFGPSFAPYSILSFISIDDIIPTATYFSTPQPALLVSQPFGRMIHWNHVMALFQSSSALNKLVLVGAVFAGNSAFMVLPPLPGLEIMHLEFQGSRFMANLVSRLVIPRLKTLKITFATREDLECVSVRPSIFAGIPEVILSGSCLNDDNLDHFYRLSPGAPLVFIDYALHLSCREPLEVKFKAVDAPDVGIVNVHGDPCTVERFLMDAMDLVHQRTDCCISFNLFTGTPHLIDYVLMCLEHSKTTRLRGVVVNFRFKDYQDFFPPRLHMFRHLSDPVIGPPFPPFGSICWVALPIVQPIVTFLSGDITNCSIVHPVNIPIVWTDLMHVLPYSTLPHTLAIHALDFAAFPEPIISSPPFGHLHTLDLAFRGSHRMARTLCRLNLSGLIRLVVRFTHEADLECLTASSALLSSVPEFVVVGSIPRIVDRFDELFGLLHRPRSIDMQRAHPWFFGLFLVSSIRRHPHPSWYSCPALSRVMVRNVTLEDVYDLML